MYCAIMKDYMRFRSFVPVFLMVCIPLTPALFAQVENPPAPEEGSVVSASSLKRDQGDTRGTFYLALTVPTANQTFSGSYIDPGMTLGGAIGASFSIFITPLLFAGGEVQLWIAASETGVPYYNISILAELGISPQAAQFEFPISIGLGINNMTYDSIYKTDFLFRTNLSAMWNLSKQWAVGVGTIYSLVVQSYLGPNPPFSDSRLHHQVAPALKFSVSF